MQHLRIKRSSRKGRVGGELQTSVKPKHSAGDGPVKPPDNLLQLVLQLIDKEGYLRRILVVCLLIFGAVAYVWSQVPEQAKLVVINHLLGWSTRPAGFYPSVEIDESRLVFDLTEWTPMPPGGDAGQCCKVTVVENILCRRVDKDAKHLARRAATTGSGIDFNSGTHPISLQRSQEERMGGPRMARYDVLLDISKEPVNAPFRAHLRSVRYGGFRDPDTEWAASTVKQPTRALTIEVRFPFNKPARNFRFSVSAASDGNNYVSLNPPPEQYTITEDAIVWTLKSPKLGHSYRIDWDWGGAGPE